jgi:hypothetical protein
VGGRGKAAHLQMCTVIEIGYQGLALGAAGLDEVLLNVGHVRVDGGVCCVACDSLLRLT